MPAFYATPLVKKDRQSGDISVLDEATWKAVLDVNLTGATMMVRYGRDHANNGYLEGVIVNMSSISRYGNRGQSNYVASKAALAANTVTWAREFAPFNIRVGAIAPGMIETPMTEGMSNRAQRQQTVPLKRMESGNLEKILVSSSAPTHWQHHRYRWPYLLNYTGNKLIRAYINGRSLNARLRIHILVAKVVSDQAIVTCINHLRISPNRQIPSLRSRRIWRDEGRVTTEVCAPSTHRFIQQIRKQARGLFKGKLSPISPQYRVMDAPRS